MKTITEHQINECNSAITIEADEPEPSCGARHNYDIRVVGGDPLRVGHFTPLRFQRGPIGEVGTNGITHEVLLAILIDRLRGFQSGPYACAENASALAHLEAARDSLHARTRARVARGVEGTHAL